MIFIYYNIFDNVMLLHINLCDTGMTVNVDRTVIAMTILYFTFNSSMIFH